MIVLDQPRHSPMPLLERLLGKETEIALIDGEILQGTPLEVSFSNGHSARLMFEETLGEYRCVDVDEIKSVRRLAA